MGHRLEVWGSLLGVISWLEQQPQSVALQSTYLVHLASAWRNVLGGPVPLFYDFLEPLCFLCLH